MVRYLEGEGVEYIFGIPGEENIDLIDSLEQSSIQFCAYSPRTRSCFHGRHLWTFNSKARGVFSET